MQVSFSPPRSAYIHIPFCVHRCGYCNFSVLTGRDDLIEPLLDALAIELSWLGEPREVDTLYFGGGTPTYLSPEPLRKLGQLVLRWHPLAANYEWTVEANPGDLDRQRVEVLAELGVNRVSLGVQSFRKEKLQLLERDHQAEDVGRAVELLRDAGLSIAMDIIFAAPGETLADWQADLDNALRLEPEHLSTYGLTWEQGTTFWSRRRRGELAPIDEEVELAMYAEAIARLERSGFEHYEVSNFARPGCRSRHNQAYWSGEGYFAAGPGAASYVTGVRETNHRSTTTYLQRVLAGESPVAEREQLDPEQRAREHLVFGLRKLEGVRRDQFRQCTAMDLDELAGATIAKFVDSGHLDDDGQRICLTQKGLFVSDSLWPEFI